MRKYTEHSKKIRIEYATKWNKTINKIVISFKPSDQPYFEKWQSLPGDTNIAKIKGLLDKI